MSRTKHPRMYHLPWSPGRTRDDLVMSSIEGLDDVVVTEKMDGENTTMYRDFIHARSIDSGNHPSRNWVKNLHASLSHLIPEDLRVCGENLYAKHSIYYDDLPSFFLVHSIWRDDLCLSWDETKSIAESLGLPTVPVLYEGLWASHDSIEGYREGYVVRVVRAFTLDEYPRLVGKFVREDHVQTDTHWNSNWIPNKILTSTT